MELSGSCRADSKKRDDLTEEAVSFGVDIDENVTTPSTSKPKGEAMEDRIDILIR